MGSHPINLAIRFLLEITGLVALAWLGWHYGKGIHRYILAFSLPVTAAVLWGVFAVPDDPSRSGEAVIAIPGLLRLLLEAGFFALATWSFLLIGASTFAWIYAVAVIVHYVASHDRVLWLLQQ